ncbi:MAG: hypothetical protein M1834_000814 [Cirrosporium novae-zelandiae]|nr:MAG: hypothetical protein M1834_000814 [Cirrosporium novae-zelandiae]
MSSPNPKPTYLYKILPASPPDPLPMALPLSPLDAKDGFIHLSTAIQVPETASRFFTTSEFLCLLKIPLKRLEDGDGEVKWEESGSHGVFPHLYGGNLGKAEVEDVMRLERKKGEAWDGVLEGKLV